MNFEIKNQYSGTIIYQAEAESFAALVQAAVRSGANLYGADLRGANLYGANLTDADLRGANLTDADLRGANLTDADLRGANLYGANLYGADLVGADLVGANLYGANLTDADLRGANLTDADLRGADLYGADLRGADLVGANLYGADLVGADLVGADLVGANLYGAKNISDLAAAQSNILPEGVIIGWKKCQSNVIVKVLISAKTPRSNATGRKCRAASVRVVEIFGAAEGISIHNNKVIYRKGETVTCHEWNENRWVECGGGIHFYLSRIEAENN